MQLTIQEKDSLLAPITQPSRHIKTLTKKNLGLDINNEIGGALQEIRDMCNKL